MKYECRIPVPLSLKEYEKGYTYSYVIAARDGNRKGDGDIDIEVPEIPEILVRAPKLPKLVAANTKLEVNQLANLIESSSADFDALVATIKVHLVDLQGRLGVRRGIRMSLNGIRDPTTFASRGKGGDFQCEYKEHDI